MYLAFICLLSFQKAHMPAHVQLVTGKGNRLLSTTKEQNPKIRFRTLIGPTQVVVNALL